MRCNPSRWLWGLIPIAMLSWGTYYRERPHVEAELSERAIEALRAAGQPWAKVSMNGRDATITGRAKKDGEPKAALDAVRSVWGIRTVQLKTDLAGTPLPPPVAIGPQAASPDAAEAAARKAKLEAEAAAAAQKAKDEADAAAALKAQQEAEAEAAAQKAKEEAEAAAALKAKQDADAAAAARTAKEAEAEAAAALKAQQETDDAAAAQKAQEEAEAAAALKAQQEAEAAAARNAKEAEAAAALKAQQDAEAAAAAQKAKEEAEAAAALKAQQEAEAAAAARKAKEEAEAAAALAAKREAEAAAAQKAKQEADMEAEAKADAERQKAEREAKAKQRKTTAETQACEKRLATAAAEGVILFERAKADIDPKSSLTIARLAEIVKACPGARIEVEGHTDSEGEPDRNQRLSERRARAVMKSLIHAGVSEDRLSAVGYGAERPVASNDTPEGMARNRRIEFRAFTN